ncbi:MAG: acyloxyacyl hydrolase [Rhodospirillaceae bacterium]|nr:acyloxyacyl hydrolase [Rhodospirillaceae bacterium]
MRTSCLKAILVAGALAVPVHGAHADPAALGIGLASALILGAGVAGEAWSEGDIGLNVQQELSSFVLGAGLYDVITDNEGSDRAGLGRVEFRFGSNDWYLRPVLGAEATTDSSFYLYGGFIVDVYLWDNFVLSPNAAVGYYDKGDARDLGSELEFRTGIEAAYRFDNGMRLGAVFHHISNAGIGDTNPGIETLTLNFTIPINVSE